MATEASEHAAKGRAPTVIAGVREVAWPSIWLTFEGCAYPCLRQDDPALALDYLMGASGGAFRFLWHPDGGPGMCNLLALGEAPVRLLAEALGRPYAYIADYERRDPAQTRERCRRLIVESIDAGRPLVGLGVGGSSEACIVTGYDAGGDVLFGRSYFQVFPEWFDLPVDESTGYFRSDAWHEGCVGVVAFGAPEHAPDRRRVLRRSLEFAVDLARVPERDTTMPTREDGGLRHHSGVAAYDHLADGFLRDEWFAGDGGAPWPTVERLMFDGIWLLLETRGHAATFLQALAADGGRASSEVARAAQLYDAEAAVLRRATDYVPLVGDAVGGDLARPEARRLLRRLVQEAKLLEEQAVRHLERALALL